MFDNMDSSTAGLFPSADAKYEHLMKAIDEIRDTVEENVRLHSENEALREQLKTQTDQCAQINEQLAICNERLEKAKAFFKESKKQLEDAQAEARTNTVWDMYDQLKIVRTFICIIAETATNAGLRQLANARAKKVSIEELNSILNNIEHINYELRRLNLWLDDDDSPMCDQLIPPTKKKTARKKVINDTEQN